MAGESGSGSGGGSSSVLETDRSKCFWAGMVTCMGNGALYASPLFTEKLTRDIGFSSAHVVILGVVLQLGYGVLTLPFARFYNTVSLRPAATDRLVTAITTFLIVGSTGLLAIVLRQPQPSVVVVSVLFTSWGMGLGWSFFHAMYLANFLFADDNAKRRRAVAAMSFAMGGGSLMFPVLFHFGTSTLSLADNFAIFMVMFTVIAAGRWNYMFRRRFAPVGTDEPAIVTSTAIPTPSEPTSHIAHATARRASDYLCNRIVWLTIVSSFFAFGIGATFNSAIGNLAMELSEETAEQTTFTMSMAFAASGLLARIATTVLYAFWDWPFVMVLWQGFMFSGIVIYCSIQTTIAAYVASISVGLGFGGVSSCLPVVVSTCFPGTAVDTSFNLALSFTFLSVGTVLLGFVQTVVYEAASLTAFGNGTQATFLFFLGAAMVSTTCALLLGVQLKHRNEQDAKSLPRLESAARAMQGAAAAAAAAAVAGGAQTVPLDGPIQPPASPRQFDREDDLQIELA